MSGKPWVIHSQNSYITIHIAQDNGDKDSPLVIAKTKLKVTKGWLRLPKEVPNYKNEHTMRNFFEKPYNWHSQQSLYSTWKD
jgi:hypothetical protein